MGKMSRGNVEHKSGSYQDYLAQTELALKEMADEAATEAERVAAEEAAAALRKIETARLKAATTTSAPEAKKTFMETLKALWTDGQR